MVLQASLAPGKGYGLRGAALTRPVISEDDVSAEALGVNSSWHEAVPGTDCAQAKQASIFDLVLPRPGAGH